MKLNKIFATAVATVAMFTVNATQAIADMYHAKKVVCTVGTSDETNIEMVKLGVTADSCEVWGGMKYTDNFAYFRCNIDGTDYTVSATEIDANKVHNLSELTWYRRPLLRRLPELKRQILLVKVAGKNSDNNKFMTKDFTSHTLEGIEAFHLANGKVDLHEPGTPVYNAETDTYSQEVSWTMTGVYENLFSCAYVWASYDDGPWDIIGEVSSYSEENSVTVTVPGNVKSVRYLVYAHILWEYLDVLKNSKWASQVSEAYELTKPSDAKQNSFFDEENGTTSGINNVNNAEQTNAPVDIYTISGTCVAQGVFLKDASASLNHGIYLVNGKKMVLGK